MSTGHLFSTGKSNLSYYASLNKTFQQLYGKNLMLHYPLYREPNESLEQRQINLTVHCIEKLGDMQGKTILEIGCGNGTQSIYLARHVQPEKVIGIDLIPGNITLAREQEIQGLPVEFVVDDAQKLDSVRDHSIDVVCCIESAFHYPMKEEFLNQIRRVLKPGGRFIIADIVNKTEDRTYITARWKRKMSYYHWTALQYRTGIVRSDLAILYDENLTPAILKGYDGYQTWIQRSMVHSFFRYVLFKLFAIIQIGINVHLLKTKEDYYLVIGCRQ